MHLKAILSNRVANQADSAPSTAQETASASDIDSSVELDASPMRAVELWIPASIALLVGLRWLLGERHSVFGDEAFHLNALSAGIANAMQGGFVDRLQNLYLFHFVYPPVFHALAVPFVLFAADPVLGGRVYSQVLALCVSILLYIVTRKIGGMLAGAVAVLTLLGTPSFVDPSRHYLLETLITLEVLALLFFIARYYQGHRLRDLLCISGLLSAGLLTKFNFFFYAVWLFVVPAGIECYQALRGGQKISATARFAGLTLVAPLVVAGPWYLARASSSSNALDLLSQQLAAGTSISNLSLDLVLFPFYWNYSPLVVAIGVVAAAAYVGHLVRFSFCRSCLQPISQSQHVILASAMAGCIGLLPLLALSGMGSTIRWRIDAVFLFVLAFGITGHLTLRPLRILGLTAAGLGAVLQLTVLYVGAVGVPSFLRVPDLGFTPRPSAIPIGSEMLARDIAMHEKRLGGTKPGEFVFFLYHEHSGPHFGSVEFYLPSFGSTLAGRIGAFWNRAVDVENIFGAKYLVEPVAHYTTAIWTDDEIKRYQRLAERLPADFRSILVEVSDIDVRFGRFKAYYVPRDKITREMVLTTIDIGRQLETVKPFLVFWDAQRIIWRARFESVEGNASLRDEIEDVLARAPATENQVIPMNRQMLRDFLVRIQEIRSRVGVLASSSRLADLQARMDQGTSGR